MKSKLLSRVAGFCRWYLGYWWAAPAAHLRPGLLAPGAEFLEAAGLRSSTLELGFSGWPPIDHVLYRPSAELRLRPVLRKLLKKEFTIEGRGPLSDHAPLLVEFQLDPPAEPGADQP